MDDEKVLDLLSGLTLLKFFPSQPAAHLELLKLILRMATTYEQIQWLVTRTISLCDEWPGPLVLRQIFCSRFKPADGIEARFSKTFPAGIPPERPIAAPPMKALPPGHVATIHAALDKQLQIVAAEKDLNNLAPYTPPPDDAHLEELRRARMRRQHREIMEEMGLKGVTQEDIDRAVEEARAKKRDSA